MEKLLRRASKIGMAVFMFCSLFLFNVAQINAHEGEKDNNLNEDYHFIYSKDSSNATLYYTLDGINLKELSQGETLKINDSDASGIISFYVNVPEGYSPGSQFQHKSVQKYDDLDQNKWKGGNYTKINSAPTDLGFNTATMKAKEKGCSYQFHYTIQYNGFRYREFKVSANPVTLSLNYNLNGGNSNPTIEDNNKYAHSAVIESGFKNEFTIPTTVPTKENARFLGWKLTNVDKVKDELYQHGDKIIVNDIWEAPNASEFTYNFEAQWAQTYSTSYYKSKNTEFNAKDIVDDNLYVSGDNVILKDGTNLRHDGSHIWIGWSQKHNIAGNNSNVASNKKQYDAVKNSGELRNAGEIISVIDKDIILYAVWAKEELVKEETYKITTSADDGGTISENEFGIYYGNNSSPITYFANEGYVIDKVVIDKGTKEEKELDLSTNPNTYTIENVNANHTVNLITSVDASGIKVEGYKGKYDGEEHYPKIEGRVANDVVEYSNDGESYSKNPIGYTNAGTYPVHVRISRGSNSIYDGEVEIIISKRIVAIRTASDKKVHDGAPLKNATFELLKGELNGVAIDGFVDGEGFDTEKTKTIGTITLPGTVVNDIVYDFDENTLKTNYEIKQELGILVIEINETDLTASAVDVEEVYNGAEYSIKVNASLKDATIAYIDEEGKYTLTEAPAFTDAGTYTVKYKVSKEGYAPVKGDATVVIAQAEVTISANDATKVEGSIDPDFAVILGETFKNDIIEYTVVREAGETTGTYTISVEVREHKNYKVLVEAGVFTITAAPVTPIPVPPVGPDAATPIVTPITPPLIIPDAPVVAPDAPVIEEVVDSETPKAEGNEKIESNKTPKSSGSENSWALVNLISAAGTLLLGMILLLSKTNKEEEEEENVNAYKRSKLMKVISSLVAILTVVLFFLTENMRLAMTLIDKWTIVMVVLLVVQVVIYFMARRWKEIDTDEDTVEVK